MMVVALTLTEPEDADKSPLPTVKYRQCFRSPESRLTREPGELRFIPNLFS